MVHFTGEAIVGTLVGEMLQTFLVATVAWSDWRSANPDGLVLSRETGNPRPYGTNPYPRYDNINRAPFRFEGEVDDRLAAMTASSASSVAVTHTASSTTSWRRRASWRYRKRA